MSTTIGTKSVPVPLEISKGEAMTDEEIRQGLIMLLRLWEVGGQELCERVLKMRAEERVKDTPPKGR